GIKALDALPLSFLFLALRKMTQRCLRDHSLEKYPTCASDSVPRAVASEAQSIRPFRKPRSLPLAVLNRRSSAQVENVVFEGGHNERFQSLRRTLAEGGFGDRCCNVWMRTAE